MRSVRAKFRVDRIIRSQASGYYDEKDQYQNKLVEVQTIELSAVPRGQSEENSKFFASTPTAKIELSTINQEAGEAFEPGGEYYVDFTPAKAGRKIAS